MIDFGRNLPPIVMDEFTAAVALEALEWHLGHLTDTQKRTRDSVDREGYANATFQRRALHGLWRLIQDHLRDLGAASPKAVADLRRITDGDGMPIPRSAANAHVLRAERAVRDAARAEYRVAYRADIAASRRMAGGKWARPRIVAVDDDKEPFSDVEP